MGQHLGVMFVLMNVWLVILLILKILAYFKWICQASPRQSFKCFFLFQNRYKS